MDDVTVLIPFLKGSRTDWLEEAIAGFPGLPYLVAENDGDLAGALNEALEQITTEYVLRFDADDIAEPGFAQELRAAVWDVDVAYPTMILADSELHKTGEFPASPFCGNRLQTWNFVPGAFIARTENLRAVGGYRGDLDALEDWDLHVRMFRAGARYKPAPQAVMLYRQTAGSRNKKAGWFSDRASMRAHYQERIVGEPPQVEATWYAQATPATTYWRCQIPARKLPGMVTQDLVGAGTAEGHVEFEDHRGTAVFQFPGSKDRAWCMLNMQAQGIRVLVEVDDNYLDETDHTVRARAGWKRAIGEGPHSVQGHRWCVEHADGVIVTTPTLAEIYGQLNPNVFVCPNSIDRDDWPWHDKPDDGVFRIGWFASFSHDKDEGLVRRALSWASRQPGVQVVTMGYEPPWNFTRTHLGWADDMAIYRRNMHLLDVGVAPIARTGWSVCRSDLKAVELGMAGALPVLSGEPPYDGWRDSPALIAHTAKDFEQQIRWCVRNQDEARALGAQARDRVLSRHLIEHTIDFWRDAVSPAEVVALAA